MAERFFRVVILFVLILLITGCGATLRYSSTAPEAKDVHPKRIAVFPVDVGTYPEAGGVIDKIVTDVLVDKEWFSTVVSPEAFKKRLASDGELAKAVTEYTQKLQTVSFSDPDLTRKIGAAFSVDALLMVNVDYWNYAVENDNKMAKAGLGMKLVETATGKILWKAAHYEARAYRFIKPAIPDVARSLTKDMISCLPH